MVYEIWVHLGSLWWQVTGPHWALPLPTGPAYMLCPPLPSPYEWFGTTTEWIFVGCKRQDRRFRDNKVQKVPKQDVQERGKPTGPRSKLWWVICVSDGAGVAKLRTNPMSMVTRLVKVQKARKSTISPLFTILLAVCHLGFHSQLMLSNMINTAVHLDIGSAVMHSAAVLKWGWASCYILYAFLCFRDLSLLSLCHLPMWIHFAMWLQLWWWCCFAVSS